MQRAYIRTLTAAFISLALFLSAWTTSTALAAPAPEDGLSPHQTGPYAVSSGAVNVRGGPGTGFYVIGVLYQGEVVPILGISPDGAWWYVNTSFGEGWVAHISVTAYNTGGVTVRDPGPIGTVVTGVVNVRNGPGPNAGVLGQVRQGQQVLVIGRNADGSWLEIRWAYGTGWVSAQHMTTTGTPAVTAGEAEVANAVPVTADAPYGIVLAAFLNVRTGPGINYAVLGRVAGGDILPIVGRSADGAWYQAQTVYGVGWVSAGYIAARNEYGGSPVTEASAAGAAVGGPIGIVNTRALNVRSGPGSQYTRLGTLAGGEQGQIVGRSADWSWWLMDTRFGNGWVSSRYIIVRGDSSGVPYVPAGGAVAPADGQAGGAAPQPAVTGPVALVSTGALHIRSGPNSVFDSLGTVLAGTRMPILGQSPDRGWWLVLSPYGNGWVSKQYVLTEGDTSGVPVVQ